MGDDERYDVLLVCSSGGHLAQLLRLRPWWSRHERRWVTFDKADAVDLLQDENVVWAHHPTTRNIPNLLRNLGVAVRLLWTWRPHLVVSNGAGVAVPFFWIAWFLGCRTAYIEVYDRIDSATLTGRLVRPVSDVFCVQWPEQAPLYRDAVVTGPL
ncbi:MAG: UDP-N-acetylglucosamine--LPS N-acetylglucosamine transferase, partial [Microthrixaceae bacterium]|nr:UDP-N-acetylglucosamine--LPS N-acetylglucosamine transferase [Microthrixaceae bacterium]